MFINRILEEKIKKLAQKFPVVVLLGGRQTGKTTLVKHLFKNYEYLNLEDIELKEYANTDPKGFIQQYNNNVIIDEVQNAPNLFSYIQVEVDKNPKPARFVLTGSQNFLLFERITQSLAGRSAVFELMPFTFQELSKANINLENYEDYLINGFYPALYSRNLKPDEWYPNFITTYIERDVRQIKNISNLLQFKQFLAILSSTIGQNLNLNSLGNIIGISHNTAKSWLSILQASYVVFLLPPFFRNIRKRITKSPKLYFYDIGLATYLLGIKNLDQLQNHFMKGALFENFIIAEVFKTAKYFNSDNKVFFYRDKNANEIDLIIDNITDITTIEIKAAKTFNNSMIRNLIKAEKLTNHPIKNNILVYGGDLNQKRNNISILTWKKFLSELAF